LIIPSFRQESKVNPEPLSQKLERVACSCQRNSNSIADFYVSRHAQPNKSEIEQNFAVKPAELLKNKNCRTFMQLHHASLFTGMMLMSSEVMKPKEFDKRHVTLIEHGE
jgi:hypothetical protein